MTPSTALSILARSRFSVMMTFLVLAVGAWALALTTVRPTYVANSALLIHEHQPQPTGGGTERSSNVVTTDIVAIRTQMDVLQSRDLARLVARNANLRSDPYFTPMTSWAQGVKTELIDLIRHYNPALVSPLNSPEPQETEQDREEGLVDRLIGMTSFVNDGRSYVITVRVKASVNAHADAAYVRALVARLANIYAEAYATYTATLGAEIMRQVTGGLDQRLQSLQDRVTATESAVQEYRTTHGLLDAQGGTSTLLGQQLVRMNDELATASAEVTRREAAVAAMDQGGPQQLSANVDSLSSVTIGRLREQRATISTQVASLSQHGGSALPQMIALRQSLADIDAVIASEVGRVNQGTRAAAETARAHESEVKNRIAALQRQYAAQQTNQGTLIALQNKADAARSVYNEYLRRSSETANTAEMENSSVVITSRANPPLHSLPPTAVHFGLAGTLVAMLVSCSVPLVRYRLYRAFQTIPQIEAATGAPVLGLVPRIRRPNSRRPHQGDIGCLNEALASVRAILRTRTVDAPRVVVVTSALAREGKTLIASALARNAATAGLRVLLVDSDLRRPSVLSVASRAGKLQRQEATSNAAPVIWEDPYSNLKVTALNSRALRPQDYLGSDPVADFFDYARQHFDLIIVDTPPTLLVSDVRVLSRYADAAVMVVDWHATPRDAVVGAARVLADSGYRLAGTIPNRLRPKTLSHLSGNLGSVHRRYKAYPIAIARQ